MEAPPETIEARPLGRVLSEERERQGLSRAEIAQRLHMSAYQVEALEIGDYARLPKGTFLRGFVRNYCKILGLDAEAMLARLAQGVPQAPAPGIVVPSQNIRFDPLGQRLANPYVKALGLSFLALFLALAGLYWWVYIRTDPPAVATRKPAPEKGPPQQIAAAPARPVEPTFATGPAAPPVDAVPVPDPAARGQAPAGVPPPPAASSPPVTAAPAAGPSGPAPKAEPRKATAGERVIKLRFRGESWVEIRDGQGKVLLSRINRPGSEAEVVGRPPFSVVVGNAPEVAMLYNDRDFPLEPHTKVAVARFTVE